MNPQFYACIGENPFDRLGSHGRHIFRDLKTLNGAINRMRRYGYKKFTIHSFRNFYDSDSFKLLYQQ